MTEPAEKRKFSSPACSMQEADDVYMGFATRPELIAFLRGLLQSGRLIALSSDDQSLRDKAARWCVVLSQGLAKLGAAGPNEHISEETVIGGGDELAQMVERLRLMLPRVRDDELHVMLATMLRSHGGKSRS